MFAVFMVVMVEVRYSWWHRGVGGKWCWWWWWWCERGRCTVVGVVLEQSVNDTNLGQSSARVNERISDRGSALVSNEVVVERQLHKARI